MTRPISMALRVVLVLYMQYQNPSSMSQAHHKYKQTQTCRLVLPSNGLCPRLKTSYITTPKFQTPLAVESSCIREPQECQELGNACDASQILHLLQVQSTYLVIGICPPLDLYIYSSSHLANPQTYKSQISVIPSDNMHTQNWTVIVHCTLYT